MPCTGSLHRLHRTPLIVGEEKTREVFGDYISTYDFKQSIDDGATVPLYYENRIPEVQLINEHFREDMERILDEAELDEAQEKRLQREFGREYQLITRDDRLERIARDIVEHFTGRGHLGKAMVVCIDKATALRMYDKVQKYWKAHLLKMKKDLTLCPREQYEVLKEQIQFAEETDMAVVVSQGQNEINDMKQKGLDIKTHRRRMIEEDLDKKFKDTDDRLRMVFVCAMWMTGFDVPCCSTIYLDKPMKNHTLMQTIARANRVFPEKNNGLIVDYFGVFRELEKALAIYAVGGAMAEPPVADKGQLINKLREAIAETTVFLKEHGFPGTISATDGFQRIKAAR
jgi:type I restriction enzyme R subunit